MSIEKRFVVQFQDQFISRVSCDATLLGDLSDARLFSSMDLAREVIEEMSPMLRVKRSAFRVRRVLCDFDRPHMKVTTVSKPRIESEGYAVRQERRNVREAFARGEVNP